MTAGPLGQHRRSRLSRAVRGGINPSLAHMAGAQPCPAQVDAARLVVGLTNRCLARFAARSAALLSTLPTRP
jgi:hypothetical protein